MTIHTGDLKILSLYNTTLK